MMLKGLKMHKLEVLQWQRMVIVPHLFMCSYGGTQEPFFFFFNTLDDGTNEGLVAVQRTRRALHNPLQLSTTFPLPKYTGLCYKVPLGKLRSGRKEALSP